MLPPDLERLREFDTCTLANAIEQFQVRMRNEGYTGPSLRALFQELPPVLGYAVTACVKSSDPPVRGGWYMQQTDWWGRLESIPAPRIVVLQDTEENPAAGAVAGEVHAHIFRKLGVDALITNGAVRDLPAVRRMGFPMFATGVVPSHSYYHIVEFGVPVEICGLPIHPGDLLYGDCHGVLSIPPQIVPELPAIAAHIKVHERRIFDLCNSPGFTLDKLKSALQSLP